MRLTDLLTCGQASLTRDDLLIPQYQDVTRVPMRLAEGGVSADILEYQQARPIPSCVERIPITWLYLKTGK